MFDEKIRRKTNLEIEGKIIVVDEAHNLEGFVDEINSFELSMEDFQTAK